MAYLLSDLDLADPQGDRLRRGSNDMPCSAEEPCPDGECCSEWGVCGAGDVYCGPPPRGGVRFDYRARRDSRLIAYVGNWQDCPADNQVDAYSHIAIAFAVSYTWSSAKNLCDDQCRITGEVPVCGNANRQDLVDGWRARGKKVILSFGGAGMGGSWAGDNNNCWEYCFGREEQVSTDLVSIVDKQRLDGIDIDYEYCYDTAGKQAGRCGQRTELYSDEKAQNFLDRLTFKLRSKLDNLQRIKGYDRGRYELTHAPMDADLAPHGDADSRYFEILKARRSDLDFLMPQFYNGYTRPAQGLDDSSGSISAAALFSAISNDLFEREPHKVVFGFCISDCPGFGVTAEAAVRIMKDLKAHNDGEFACNGGAFFWVALRDVNGLWSDLLANELSATSGCSDGSNDLAVGSSGPDDDDYHLQNPHMLDEGKNEPENYGGVDLEDVDKEDYEDGSDSDGRPSETSLCKDFPTCESVGIADNSSCREYCRVESASPRNASYRNHRWVEGKEGVGPLKCGKGCACLRNDFPMLRQWAHRWEYECVGVEAVTVNTDAGIAKHHAAGDGPYWISLGLAATLVAVASFTIAFYQVMKRRRAVTGGRLPSGDAHVASSVHHEGTHTAMRTIELPDGEIEIAPRWWDL